MGRHVTAASSQYLEAGSAPSLSQVGTILVWFKGTTFPVGIVAALDSSAATSEFGIYHNATGQVRAYTYDGTTLAEAVSSTTLVAGTIYSLIATFNGVAARDIYVNGGGHVSNATSVTVTPNRVTVGAVNRTGVISAFADADLAEIAIWNIVLSAGERASLDAGANPGSIRADALVFYTPLGGISSPEPDQKGGRDLTLHAGPTAVSFIVVGPPSQSYGLEPPNPVLAKRPLAFLLDYSRNYALTYVAPPLPPPPLSAYAWHWPNPVRRINAPAWQQSQTQSLVIPPPPPLSAYAWHWPNPVRRINAPAWQQSQTQSLVIPRDADYFYGLVWISVNGVARAQGRSGSAGIDFASLTISDELDQTPNTCQFVARGFTPTVGQTVIVTLGSATIPNPERIFAGTILQVQQVYSGTPTNQSFRVSCIDWTWQLNTRKVIKQYTGMTATAIAIDLLSTYTSGFTANHVAGLGVIDAISFTNIDLTDALTQLAKRAGGYWFVDYNKDLHLFVTEGVTQPTPLTAGHPSLTDFSITRDLSQWVTRQYSEGGGGNAAAAVSVGDTILPVDVGVWYVSTGGTVVCGQQQLTYTGVQAGGDGSLVGAGVAPTLGPTVAPTTGAGIDSGEHDWAIVWGTAAGRTLPSPLTVGRVGPVTAPTYTPAIVPNNGIGFQDRYAIGDTVEFVFTYSESTGSTGSVDFSNESAASASTGSVVVAANPSGGPQLQGVTVQYTTAPTVTWIHGWIRVNGGSYALAFILANNFTTGTITGTGSMQSQTGVWATALPSARGNQAALAGITVGPTGTTFREVYRTVAGGSQLKLQQTIANNTATVGVQDATADASLGANAPVSDTSGLTQAPGQVNPGSTTLLTAGATAFSASGGWAIIGNGQQAIRYTGVSGNTLTGIPTTGNGAITATVSYGSTVTAAPALTGIPASGPGSVVVAAIAGTPVNLLAIVDDLAGQAALAVLIGGDGVQESYVVDGRIAYTECLARATARIALNNAIRESIAYVVRDPQTASGKTIVVDLVAPTSVSASYKIQRVTITQFSASAGLFPTYTAEASSDKLSFEDELKNIIGGTT